MPRSARPLLAARAALLASVVLAAASMETLPAAAATAEPACIGNSVIVSMPLINAATKVSSWNYGYVQLWYNDCTGDNWGRVVSLVGTAQNVSVDTYNNIPRWTGFDSCGEATVCTSTDIYSPNNPAGAFGVVQIGNATYYAESDQAGANCSVDAFAGGPCLGLATGTY